MKRIVKIICFVSLIWILNINAEECNEFDIDEAEFSLTDREKSFIVEFYGEEFLNKMTIDDYNWIIDMDVNNRNYEIVNSGEKSSSYSSNSKSLSIAKSCSTIDNTCQIIILLQWTKNPFVRSYDVVGARLYNTSFLGDLTTKLSSSSGIEYSSNNKILSNGLGTSVKLPLLGSNIYVQQKFKTNKSGKVYASYQHSTSIISLNTSYSYTIGSGGYGGVFVFNSGVSSYFDGMSGVDITL